MWLRVFSEDEKCLNPVRFVGFEVLTAVFVKSSVFWPITPCSPLKVNVSEEHISSIFMVEE
jgi:hypothetical protein